MKTPMKAIRSKCLDCCCDSAKEVKMCTLRDCALHSYRMGKNPNMAHRGKKGEIPAGFLPKKEC